MDKFILDYNRGVEGRTMGLDLANLTPEQKAVLFVLNQNRYQIISQKRLRNDVNATLFLYFDGNPTVTLDGKRVRDVVGELREMGFAIVSKGGKGGGYWVARNREEVKEFLEREYWKKSMTMLFRMKRMKDGAIASFGGQRVFDPDFEEFLDGVEYHLPEKK